MSGFEGLRRGMCTIMCCSDEGDALKKLLSLLGRYRTPVHVTEAIFPLWKSVSQRLKKCWVPYNLCRPFSHTFIICHNLIVMNRRRSIFDAVIPIRVTGHCQPSQSRPSVVYILRVRLCPLLVLTQSKIAIFLPVLEEPLPFVETFVSIICP